MIGYLLGAAILVTVVAGLVNWILSLVASPSQAVPVVAILMVAKFGIGITGYYFHWL